VTITPAIGVNTGALSVDQNLTLPNNVMPSPNLLIINTPFILDEWEAILNSISPFNIFSDVLTGICSGFNMGIISPLLFIYTLSNHNLAIAFPDHVLSYIHKELSVC
jgi:hypothetical protein